MIKELVGVLAYVALDRVIKPLILWSRGWRRVNFQYCRKGELLTREFAFEVAESELRKQKKIIDEGIDIDL